MLAIIISPLRGSFLYRINISTIISSLTAGGSQACQRQASRILNQSNLPSPCGEGTGVRFRNLPIFQSSIFQSSNLPIFQPATCNMQLATFNLQPVNPYFLSSFPLCSDSSSEPAPSSCDSAQSHNIFLSASDSFASG